MKRRTSIILFLLLGSFFISSTVFSANTDIVITEIGAYESSGHEWIEVWNKGSEPVDLAGWKFWESNINHSLSVSTRDFILDAGEYGAIVQDAAQFILDYPFFAGSVFDSSWSSLNESGEEIGIKDSSGNFVEQFTYTSAPDFSLQRVDPFLAEYTAANWAQHSASNTVGMVNFFAPTSTPDQAVPTTTPATSTPDVASSTPAATSTSQQIITEQNNSSGSNSQTAQPVVQSLTALKINELVADPGDSNEWVELYNTSATGVDITGAMICDNRNTTSTCKKLTGPVAANSWLFIDLQTKSFLNNSGDSVILKDASGLVIDRLDYEDELVPDEGQSLARRVDGIDTGSDADWIVTDTISPGTANIVSVSEESNNSTTTASTTSGTTTTSTGKTIKKPTSIFVGDIIAPSSAGINEIITFNAENIADPRGGTMSFVWTLQTGEHVVGPEIKTSFSTAGLYTIIVFVTSTSGYGEEKKTEITVGAGLSLNADIIISELLPNPDGEDSGEFIELKNNSAGQANISGWLLKVGEKNYALPENTIIAADGFLTFYKAATKLNLVNTAGKVELLNKDKTTVDLVKYEKPVSGKSYAFIDNQWRWADPSPGSAAVIVSEEVEGQVAGEKISSTAEKKTVLKAGPLVASIAEARAAAKGQPTKLQGIVTVVPDIFGSQFFYITGDNAGIQIYQSKKDFPPLGIGDLVEITGTVSEASGIKRINIPNREAIDILSLGNALEAMPLNLDEINEDNAGALVAVEGEITEVKSTFMYVDDGAGEIKVYFKKNTEIDKKLLKEGGRVKVTGVLEKTSGEWQLWPRGTDDIEPVAGEVLGEKIIEPAVVASQPNTVNKYLIATSIGLAGLLMAFLARGGLAKFFKKD